MDVPGHSTATVTALPTLFGFASAPTLGIVNFVNDSVILRLQEIFLEIDAVLPSPFFAIGGDEVDFAAVSSLPEVTTALKAKGYNSVVDLYRAFIVTMQTFAASHNKTLHVWEGFGPQAGAGGHKPVAASTVEIHPQGLSVTIFDGVYYNPLKLASDGYSIINSATAPLYINTDWSQQQLIYQWHPWLFGDLAYVFPSTQLRVSRDLQKNDLG
jgi:N-acetyl-beta-hexosaminidase